MLAALAFSARAWHAQAGTIFTYDQKGQVGEFNASNGATINANFASLNLGGNEGFGIAFDNQGHLFVSNETAGTVSEYKASTGALLNSDFASGFEVTGLAVDNNGHLFVASESGVGEYNISNDTTINSQLIPNPNLLELTGMAAGQINGVGSL
jgi:outer membrane protein assembly factor BamB